MAIEFGSPQAADVRAADRANLAEQASYICWLLPVDVAHQLFVRHAILPETLIANWLEQLPVELQSAGYYYLAQLFLSHAVNNAKGRTLYEEFAADPRLLLGPGKD